MIEMDENKLEPMVGVEHAETGVFDTFMRGRIVDQSKDVIDPLPAFDDEVPGFLFIDFFRRIFLRHHWRHLDPHRDGV